MPTLRLLALAAVVDSKGLGRMFCRRGKMPNGRKGIEEADSRKLNPSIVFRMQKLGISKAGKARRQDKEGKQESNS